MKNTISLMLTLLFLFVVPAVAQDGPSHFYGQGYATFRDADHPGQVCRFAADVEVKGPPEYPDHEQYDHAFSYTVRNLTPLTPADAGCRPARPAETFDSLCRAFSMSTGSIGIDVPALGTITVAPRSPAVRQVFSDNAVYSPSLGVGFSYLKFRLSVLPDGGLEVFAFVPLL